MSVSGLPTDRFRFEGFLPAKSGARQSQLKSLKSDVASLVFYEAPHRIEKLLTDLVDIFGATRKATVAREMTKKFEQIEYGELTSLLTQLKEGGIVSKGEFVVVVEGNKESVTDTDETVLMQALLSELPPRKAASVAQKLTGRSKKDLYDVALALKASDP